MPTSTPVRIVIRDSSGNFVEINDTTPLPVDTGGGGSGNVNIFDSAGGSLNSTGGSLDVNITGGTLSLSESTDSIAVYGNDGGTNRILKTDAAGELQVDVLSQPALSDSTDSVSIGDGTDTLGINADGSINVTSTGSLAISSSDTFSIDAFGRWRTSEPFTIFDSKQLLDEQPLFWDDVQRSGSGTTSTHVPATASTNLSVSAATAGNRTRRTFRRFNYQPGKSQLIFLTWANMLTASGNQKWAGLMDDDNGLFFLHDEGTMKIVRRTSVTGSPVDNDVSQASWNLDVMDGSGPSGVTLDFSLTQIGVIDFEWLGVGRVRMGFVVDGKIYYIHEFNNANNLADVYMSTPNLPIEYGIENLGTGALDTFKHICSTVISEGGQQELGTLRYDSTGATHVDANTAGTLYAVMGIRLKSTHTGVTVQITDISMLTETSDNFEWLILWNPTVAGTFTYTGISGSAVETAKGATANTVSGGTVIAGGYASVSSGNAGSIARTVNTILALGVDMAGNVDEMVLCVRPLTSNADIQGGMNWRELS